MVEWIKNEIACIRILFRIRKISAEYNAILIQMIAFMDMKLVIGETVAVLLGGLAYLMLIVRARAWNYPKSNGDTLKKTLSVA